MKTPCTRIHRFGLALTIAAGLLTAAPSTVALAHPAPAAPDTISVVGLGPGSTGPGVRAVQEKLLSFGYSVRGGADGVFGPSTESTLRVFQRQNGLNPTGIVTENTALWLGLRDGVPATSGGNSTTSGNSNPTNPNTNSNSSAPTSVVGLAPGSRGPGVKAVQEKLVSLGYVIRGGADGVFGPGTESTLRVFQRQNGLNPTGIVTENTALWLGLHDGVPATSGGNSTASGNSNPTNPNTNSNSSAPTSVVGLRRGMSGESVRQLQRAILDTGLVLRGGADGMFGPATERGVKLVQRVNGLPETGVVNEATARALGLTGNASSQPTSAPAGTSANTSTSSGSTSGGGPTANGYAKYDERGARVVALQKALINAGIAVPGGADGAFGGGTAGAVMKFQREKGLRATGRVDEATANALGLQAMPAPAAAPPANVTLQAKPLASGPCWYGDTWQAWRGGGRVHLGVDIGAAPGTPLQAVASGRITQIYRNQARAGNGLKITTSDGTYFFYAHLQDFAPGIGLGTPVRAGQVIGYMGSTGNAGITHLHLEVHPRGGSAINPYPLVKAIGAC